MENRIGAKEKPLVTEETGLAESEYAEEKPSLPDSDHIWTSPPEALPGPDNHPFFSRAWNTVDLTEFHQPSGRARTTSPSESHTAPRIITNIFPSGPPPVYPFIPAPVIDMLPSTPENEKVQKSENSVGAGSPTISTPGLTNSATNIDDSPRSRLSISNDEPYSLGLDQSPARLVTAEFSHASVASKSPESRSSSPPASNATPTLDVQPVCHLTYIRAIPNEATTEPAVLLTGQLWRSSNEKKKGWRRNQWVVDVR
jgi:hypothetical protein